MEGDDLKCPLCMNDGTETALTRCSGGSLYMAIWFGADSGLPTETDMTDYIEEETILFECGYCKFSGPQSMFEEVVFPHLQKDENGYYLDNFITNVGPCRLIGKLYYPKEMVLQCWAIVRIHNAASLEELPEALCGEDTPLRQLAKVKYRELEDKKCQK